MHVKILEDLDFHDIVISLKSSNTMLTIKAYELASKTFPYPLHVGVTEAGTALGGTIKSALGIGTLLYEGIGNTIRVSLSDDPVEEIKVAKILLKELGLLKGVPTLVSCPTCGRIQYDLIPIAKEMEDFLKDIHLDITVAIMGCAVNGPGEARHADIGIAGGVGEGLLIKHGEIVKFGENISVIQKRITFDHMSILEVYKKSLEVFRDYYRYEVIEGSERKNVEKIPEAAFREAIANGLIHRMWDVNSHIRISMFDNHIDIVSPGGLPTGISEEEYLNGKTSVLRNRNLANVFYRLGFVEIFGTGITRIKQLYESSFVKPRFEVSENTIKIELPVFEDISDLTDDEHLVLKALSKTVLKSISEIVPSTPFGKSKVSSLLKILEKKGVVLIQGKGRSTKYIIK